MAEDFPNLTKKIDTQVQETQMVPNKMNPNRSRTRHSIIKMLKELRKIISKNADHCKKD